MCVSTGVHLRHPMENGKYAGAEEAEEVIELKTSRKSQKRLDELQTVQSPLDLKEQKDTESTSLCYVKKNPK